MYRAWVGCLKPTLRQVHTAGERVFVDFAGHTMEVIDGATGEIHRAEVFVAVLGASSYVFAQAAWTQSLPDWIGAHVNMLAFIGGVARAVLTVSSSNWVYSSFLPTFGPGRRDKAPPGALRTTCTSAAAKLKHLSKKVTIHVRAAETL